MIIQVTTFLSQKFLAYCPTMETSENIPCIPLQQHSSLVYLWCFILNQDQLGSPSSTAGLQINSNVILKCSISPMNILLNMIARIQQDDVGITQEDHGSYTEVH